ncbi:TPA: molecular chaperone [Serratia marcescens]|uniref:Molecular chaperone n=2 Tax=Serratia TaxID=613 RepID=A0A9X8VLZ1_SERMA|nr:MULTISPECIES: molecular chaperone [Serratia]MBS3894523.1 molecular chaperone [Serratia marcescens]TXE22535.1 molecular chaperone [Serratia ureilytica]HBC7422435.1 molecular chaperone [Serratia marcescens]
MSLRRVIAPIIGGILSMCVGGAHADGGVSFSHNRLVYNEKDQAVGISAINHGDTPYLIQSGVSGSADKSTAAPFLVTPPLFRLDGRAQNMMRIIKVGAPLPADRESIFYFYATAIPGQGASAGKVDNADGGDKVGAKLSIAMKTILKLLYRPANLPVSIDQAHGMMHFVQQGNTILIKNPTPYYQSFSLLEFDGAPQNLDKHESMVAPMSHLVFPVNKRVNKVTWSVMNDYGGTTPRISQNIERQ